MTWWSLWLVRAFCRYLVSERGEQDQFVRELEHVKALRFEVLDWEPRQFHVERWSSHGPDGEWIDLGGPASLSDLVDEFVAYLGEERFHELY